MSEIIYLNGQYLPIEQAHISVRDRGFLFADGVYEVVSIHHGQPLQPKAHLKRLRSSLAAIELSCPLTDNDFMTIIEQLLIRNEEANQQNIYIQISRGTEKSRHHHYLDCQPTIYARLEKIIPKDLSQGTTAITAQDIRWQRCDIKSINRLANVILTQQAKRVGAEEVIILDNDMVLEGATSNVLIVKNHHLITPPLSHDILSGVTRQTAMKLAANIVPCSEQALTLSELYAADEVWITSSTRGIAPIIKIDDHTIGNGQPGPIYQQIQAEYQKSLL